MDSPLTFEKALPDSPELERFDCGDPEVNAYFHSAQWAARLGQGTFHIRACVGGPTLGFVTAEFRKSGRVSDEDPNKARFFTIYAFGLNLAFHGQKNPRAPQESYAASAFRVLESLARTKADCAGLALWVREHNARAIAFYEKVGFIPDPAGPVPRDGGPRHITLRKLFSPM